MKPVMNAPTRTDAEEAAPPRRYTSLYIIVGISSVLLIGALTYYSMPPNAQNLLPSLPTPIIITPPVKDMRLKSYLAPLPRAACQYKLRK